MYARRAATAYREVDLETAPKTQIVERLFERFARDVTDAKAACLKRDIKGKAAAIDHALRIVTELRSALDHNAAPELCAHLSALYGFVAERLSEANLKLAAGPLDAATKVMTTLGDAFRKAHQEMK